MSGERLGGSFLPGPESPEAGGYVAFGQKSSWTEPPCLEKLWEQMTDEDFEFGLEFKAAYEEKVEKVIRCTLKKEWNNFMKKEIETFRRRDELFDYKTALQLCYNEEIDDEEADRRMGMLDQDQVARACEEFFYWRNAPRQECWRRRRKPEAFPKDLRHEIRDSWEDKQDALGDLYHRSLEIRRSTFGSFYSDERSSWGERFKQELLAFEAQEKGFKDHDEKSIAYSTDCLKKQCHLWKENRDVEIAICRKLSDDREREILEKFRIAQESTGSSLESSLKMMLRNNKIRTQSEIHEISQKLERIKKSWQRTSEFNRDALRWFRLRKDKLAAIKTRFTRELRHLKNMQKAETNVLFPHEVASNIVPTEAQSDWKAAIETALKSYSIQTSPVDCPFSKGYGDTIESTRSEKSGSKDWSLHGLRGTEAIQMSSHRGPPTDRPPDKPPPAVSALAGCSQERANTHRTFSRLAFLCRSSRCMSGNVSSPAATAILGSHIAIFQRAALMQSVPLTKSIGS
jgi:DNA-binding TFAR19-related protein (PDSD5 family)